MGRRVKCLARTIGTVFFFRLNIWLKISPNRGGGGGEGGGEGGEVEKVTLR